tara:strand:+ start:439 stop:1827 length:1389 start_codon:yes stop_codon:yes gene_type:complete
MVLIKADINIEEVEENLEQVKRIQDQKKVLNEEEEEPRANLVEQFKKDLNTWLPNQYGSEVDILRDISKNLNINLTEASDYIIKFPIEPIISEKNIPNLVKELRDMRRQFKGEDKQKVSKGIEHLITAYEHYIQKCTDSIYWLNSYQSPINHMTFNLSNIQKLHSIKDGETREKIIDLLCKMWENEIEKSSLTYSAEYTLHSNLVKECKKDIRKILKEIPHQSIRKSKKEMVEEHVKSILCNNPGLSSNEIHSRLPKGYNKISTPQSISKMLKKVSATNVDGEYYLVRDLIKKDLYSYVAGFIDSDGYITMDKTTAPRIGMIATGNRGRAFFTELESELKCGRLHLDQKVGENSRSQHRLNFYSQSDIGTILDKCLPHLRMKQEQGKLLLEAIRIKKHHKKADWAKPRLQEIFKLMKYENWKDSKGQGGKEFIKYDIDPDVVVKYHDNCKMSLMEDIESGVE